MTNIVSKINAQRIIALFVCIMLCVSLSPLTAHAESNSQNDLLSRIDAAQSQLNAANNALDEAWLKHQECLNSMNEAQATIEAASEQIVSVQTKLSSRAIELYKGSPSTSYLSVLLGAESLGEFLGNLVYYERITARDMALIQEAKGIHAQAQAALTTYQEMEAQAKIELDNAAAAQSEIQWATDSLKSEYEQITSDMAEQAAQQEQSYVPSSQQEEQSPASQGSAFANPCPSAWESSGYGWRDWDNSFHKGTDMAANWGSPVYAAEGGTVIYAVYNDGWNGGAGNWIWISHGNGLATKYMHLSSVSVSTGDYVYRGQYIGAVGSTGNSSGPHLHFQVELNGTAVSPYQYL